MSRRKAVIALEIATVMMLMLMCFAQCVFAASKFVVLHTFNSKDGANPTGALILDASGNLYGTAFAGGNTTTCAPPYGCGTVFELTPGANGKWTGTVLHSFSGSDGDGPFGRLIFDAAGNLYGTTSGGGVAQGDRGTVFKLTPGANGKWSEMVLHSFNVGDGASPMGGLIFDAAGNLYGTTLLGGTNICSADRCGTVFELTPTTKGEWKETVLHSFSYANGAFPHADLIFDANGNLYGTTQRGGNLSFCNHKGCGTVFQLISGGNGKWTEKVLHAFRESGGIYPEATLISDSAGNFYSTTLYGPSGTTGEVFELKPVTGGFTVLHAFSFADGAYPTAGLVFNSAGDLFGTTSSGGSGEYGTVFELTPGSNGQWTETVLHGFGFNDPDGSIPYAGLVMDGSGNLYGTTTSGGNTTACSEGCGVVFEITP